MSDMNLKNWFLHDGTTQTGPFTLLEARAIALQHEKMAHLWAWRTGSSGWLAVSAIPEFLTAPTPPQAAAVIPRPIQSERPVAVPRSDEISMLISISKDMTKDTMNEDQNPEFMDPSVLKVAQKEAKRVQQISDKGRLKEESSLTRKILKGLLVVATLGILGWIILMYPLPVHASGTAHEPIDVDKFKDQYWDHGNKETFSVLQNRAFRKSTKAEIGFFAGIVDTDPFLNAYNYGGFLSYHFSEYFALTGFVWKYVVGSSSNLKALESDQGVTVNTNIPSLFIGGEVAFSPLYGKLSLMGNVIIYLDSQITAGAGKITTETGNYIAPIFGIGEQIFLSRFITFRIDYHLYFYSETLQVKTIGSSVLGPALPSPRLNVSNAFTAGITFLIF